MTATTTPEVGAEGIRSTSPRPASHSDVIAVMLLLVMTAAVASEIRLNIAPFEDAAMLMRYAEHLTAGNGLVWNVGQPPVDGATDFLFTVATAGITALGVPVELAARLIELISWLATIAIVYYAARHLHRAPVVVAFLASAAIVVSTASLYVTAGFGAPFFGLWVAITAVLASRLRDRTQRQLTAVLFGLSWLVLGLTRPEGVLLGAFIALALLIDVGWMRGSRLLRIPLLVMIVLGGSYFLWHWAYFGHPLPNPFYKKGGATLHGDGLFTSIRGAALFAVPFGAVWLAALADRVYRRAAWLTLIPIALFTVVWVLLSPEMNFAARFQYPIVVLISLSWPPLASADPVNRVVRKVRLSGDPVRIAATMVAVTVLIAMAAVPATLYFLKNAHDLTVNDERAHIGGLMAPFASKNYVIATTEAGLIPLRSGWRALDTWGLNDERIAHRGQLSDTDLASVQPTVIFTHAPFAPGTPPVVDRVLGQKWTDMNVILDRWASANAYLRARTVQTSGGSAWVIWVKPGLPDSSTLVRLLGCQTFVGARDMLTDQVRGLACTSARSPVGS